MPRACYIHIPFCLSKCKYCSFVSFTSIENTLHLREGQNLRFWGGENITGYVYSLLKEISENYTGESLNTLYFGGGTPSLLPLNLAEKIIRKFNLNQNAEITFELNPDDGSLDYIKGLKELGINRLSIGSQTFDDNLLKLIGRRHNSNQIIQTVQNAKEAGFENISLDFIYGLPTQTVEGVNEDLKKFLELNIQHISTYGLKIEGGSYWGNNNPENLPDNDTQADMYEGINEILTNAGFERYEVSNFSKQGYESKHNLTYWNNEEYYGFGVSAHGYVDGVRYSNYCTLEDYMNKPDSHEYGRILNEKEKLEEEIFLGFRKTSGINTEKIKQKFGIDFGDKYKKILEKYSDYIIQTPIGYAFNFKGTMLSNEILPEFLS